MSNFEPNGDGVRYTETEGFAYQSTLRLDANFPNGDSVGICLIAEGYGEQVVLSVNGVADVQQFLYEVAVQSKLIKDGDPLVLEAVAREV